MAPTGSVTSIVTTPQNHKHHLHDLFLRIRSYSAQDYKAVCELFSNGMLVYRPSKVEDLFLYDMFTDYVVSCCQGDLANIEQIYMQSGGQFWVVPVMDSVTGDEELAAMVALEGKGNGVGELRRLSVNGQYRGLGLGSQLVRFVEQWASTHGFHTLQLHTDNTMPPAVELYKRLGYTRTHHETLRDDPPYYLIWFSKTLTN